MDNAEADLTTASPLRGSSRVVADRLAFAEGPRWHDRALWWSDMHGHRVCRLASDVVETVCEVPGRPSGLGWLPDGRMLVVSMTDKRVLRLEPDGTLSLHADLSALAPRRCNDMVVDAQGGAYVGNFGFDLDSAEPPVPTVLIRVELDGAARVVADRLWFPNGMLLLNDGRTLVVAETWAARLTVFDISPDGGLSHRRVWAALDPSVYPDGICSDPEGAIWVASPSTSECLRVCEGGEVTNRLAPGRRTFACALGGADGRTLYLCVADSHDPGRQQRERNGAIEAWPVAAGSVGAILPVVSPGVVAPAGGGMAQAEETHR